jgi:hypothetical protein
MDEVTCPKCQGLNPATALTCRFCHSPLTKNILTPQSTAGILGNSTSTNPQPSSPDENENNIPEWLKKVRELKKADEEKEREKEQWRQQSFLNPDGNPAAKSKTTSSATKSKPSKKIHPSSVEGEPTQPHTTPKAETDSISPKAESKSNPAAEKDSPDENDDLPEGFTPLGN